MARAGKATPPSLCTLIGSYYGAREYDPYYEVYWGYIGIMGKKMETTIRGPAFLTHVPQALQSKSGEDFPDPKQERSST